MEERATEAGFASILCNTTAAAFREVDYVHMLLDRGADGMIFISCEMTNMSGDHDHYARLVEEGARIVFVNGALNSLSVPSIAVDERLAGEYATQHLIDLGHTKIGYVAGPEYYLPTRQKAAGRDKSLCPPRGSQCNPHLSRFPAEHRLLARDAPVIAGQRAALAQRTVAGHHERHRVAADRGADGA